MKLFQHKALGGAIVVTNGPRYFEREGGHVVNRDCTTVATFAAPSVAGDQPWDNAYAAFKHGLTSGPFAGSSLFDEDTEQFIVGDVGELAA